MARLASLQGGCRSPRGEAPPFDSRVRSQYDTIYASKVEDGAVVVDGDLRDWHTHVMNHERCYAEVPFAKLNG